MPFDWTIATLTEQWGAADWIFWTTATLAATVLVGWTIRTIRDQTLERRVDLFASVTQVGLAWTVIHGTFQFFRYIVGAPDHESWLTAGIIESVMWVGASMIFVHGRKPGSVGWGYGGPLFLAAGIGGGTLAVLASTNAVLASGRIVIVILGMWTLTARLLKATNRAGGAAAPSRWTLQYWRARRTRFNPEEWEVRKIARAIRWANGPRPASWIGARNFVRLAEKTTPAVVAKGRARAAMVHAVKANVRWTGETMVQLIESADRWTGTTEGVWTADGPTLDRSNPEGLDHRPDRSAAPARTTAIERTGPRSKGTLKPARTIPGEIVNPDRIAAKVAAIKAHVGDDWPDVTFSGDKIMAMKIPGCRNKDTANALATILNEMAQTELAARFDPLTH